MAISERRDNKSLFDGVYLRHHGVVYAYLFGQVQEADAAADLLQDTFVRVWRHVAQLRTIPIDRQLFWILGIARNQGRDYFRRRQVRIRAEQVVPVPQMDDPHRVVQSKEAQCLIDAAIKSLPESLRMPLTLSVMAGLNSKEIADILGRPAGTVRYQIGEARKRIMQEIKLAENDGQEGGEQ